MALMAEDLVVIGQGSLISAGSVDDFVARFTQRQVVVRSPEVARLADLLRESGATSLASEPDGAVVVSGLDAVAVGDLAGRAGITLHELSNRSASLERAFLEATGGATDFDALPQAVPAAVTR
jgi:ABC-2 type transport system ATP-binding protein